jgi:hypothetical protein
VDYKAQSPGDAGAALHRDHARGRQPPTRLARRYCLTGRPGYVVAILAWLGYALVRGSAAAGIALAALIFGGCAYQVHIEEELLCHVFGQRFDEYWWRT